MDGEERRDGEQQEEVVIDAQYVFIATGTLSTPQIPRVPGLDTFAGPCFHTSRWDYGVTGGTPSDWRLDKLRGKTVGIVGTGATAAQVVPELARWAERLYVFQRTPSSVDERGQRATDPEEWNSKVAKAKGWQRARAENFNAYLTSSTSNGEEDLVADAWSRMPSYAAILGAPGNAGIVTPEKVPGHVAQMHEWDLSRAERVRARVDSIVADAATADKLKAWYPVWCKRPVFHDEYLAAFNRANVTLVDTDGKGIDGLSRAGVVANGIEYPVDVLVLSTGFVSPAAGTGSPASRAGVKVYGREGLDMDAKWGRQGAATLHGVASNGFPNFFFPGPSQAGVTSNFTFALDRIGAHVAFILAEAEKRAQNPEKLIVEVTKEAEEAWSKEVMIRAGWFAAVRGCTPSYINAEGESDKAKDLAEQMKAARAAPWGEGVTRYLDVLRTWREEGGLTGYDLLEQQPITSK
ncbi:FAD-binding monooxygenase ausC [Lasiodiplodia hormozganensis]|uniref:FAD-binding monooxygenase ausC n=1 Tax=Lasiodiplodia hormozganensis TaxID=869390 RepID=A0AA39U0B8_9PEZI|nr:FAD-binding monooxygenase ausC [Lasiodiplodia hormozganensis]